MGEHLPCKQGVKSRGYCAGDGAGKQEAASTGRSEEGAP